MTVANPRSAPEGFRHGREPDMRPEPALVLAPSPPLDLQLPLRQRRLEIALGESPPGRPPRSRTANSSGPGPRPPNIRGSARRRGSSSSPARRGRASRSRSPRCSRPAAGIAPGSGSTTPPGDPRRSARLPRRSSSPGLQSPAAWKASISLSNSTSSQLINSPSRHHRGSQAQADESDTDRNIVGNTSVFAARVAADAMKRSRWPTLPARGNPQGQAETKYGPGGADERFDQDDDGDGDERGAQLGRAPPATSVSGKPRDACPWQAKDPDVRSCAPRVPSARGS